MTMLSDVAAQGATADFGQSWVEVTSCEVTRQSASNGDSLTVGYRVSYIYHDYSRADRVKDRWLGVVKTSHSDIVTHPIRVGRYSAEVFRAMFQPQKGRTIGMTLTERERRELMAACRPKPLQSSGQKPVRAKSDHRTYPKAETPSYLPRK